jgi:hypothetical protein
MNNENREQQMMVAAEAYAAEIYKDEPDNFHTDEQLCETINDFCAGWRAADQHPQWIPVEERKPKERGHYLVYSGYGDVWLSEWMQDNGGRWDWYVAPICVGIISKVTHWMPLPEAPRKEVEK